MKMGRKVAKGARGSGGWFAVSKHDLATIRSKLPGSCRSCIALWTVLLAEANQRRSDRVCMSQGELADRVHLKTSKQVANLLRDLKAIGLLTYASGRDAVTGWRTPSDITIRPAVSPFSPTSSKAPDPAAAPPAEPATTGNALPLATGNTLPPAMGNGFASIHCPMNSNRGTGEGVPKSPSPCSLTAGSEPPPPGGLAAAGAAGRAGQPAPEVEREQGQPADGGVDLLDESFITWRPER